MESENARRRKAQRAGRCWKGCPGLLESLVDARTELEPLGGIPVSKSLAAVNKLSKGREWLNEAFRIRVLGGILRSHTRAYACTRIYHQ